MLQSLPSWSFRTWTTTKLQLTNIKTIMSMHWSLWYPALWNQNNLYIEHHSVICQMISCSTSLLYEYHVIYHYLESWPDIIPRRPSFLSDIVACTVGRSDTESNQARNLPNKSKCSIILFFWAEGNTGLAVSLNYIAL